MENVVDLLLPLGPLVPVDWATTPDGQELVTVSFSGCADAGKACEVRAKELRKHGKQIPLDVFRCL